VRQLAGILHANSAAPPVLKVWSGRLSPGPHPSLALSTLPSPRRLRQRHLLFISARFDAKKKFAKNTFAAILMGINATPDDNRKAVVAHAGRPLESAANFTRGGGPPTPDHDASDADRRKRVKVEQGRLIQWAQENGKLGTSGRLPPIFARGGEHQVYFQNHTRRYLKVTLIERKLGYGLAFGSHIQGATPSEYLDRLDLQNQIFHDDIRLERIVANGGQPIIIISQPAIKGTKATQPALDAMMTGMGYEKLADGAYYDEPNGLLIFDLFPRNAFQGADGQIYPIDPVVQRIAPDFGQFLRDNPHTINLAH